MARRTLEGAVADREALVKSLKGFHGRGRGGARSHGVAGFARDPHLLHFGACEARLDRSQLLRLTDCHGERLGTRRRLKVFCCEPAVASHAQGEQCAHEQTSATHSGR